MAFNSELGILIAADFSHIHIWRTQSGEKLCTLITIGNNHALVYKDNFFDYSDEQAKQYIRFSARTSSFPCDLFADDFRSPNMLRNVILAE